MTFASATDATVKSAWACGREAGGRTWTWIRASWSDSDRPSDRRYATVA